MARSSSKTGLVVSALLTAVVLAALDLTRPESLIRSAWDALVRGQRPDGQERVETLRRGLSRPTRQ